MLGRRMLHETYDTNTAELWREPERRRRLVRLCAQISGDRNTTTILPLPIDLLKAFTGK